MNRRWLLLPIVIVALILALRWSQTQAGEFRTFVVDALQQRLDSASGPPVSLGYTINYAPSVGAVVRFHTSVLTGPGRGRSFGSELRSLYHPDDALKKP